MKVPNELITAIKAIIKFNRLIYKLETSKSVESAIYSIPYNIQKLIPMAGTNNEIDDA